MAATPTLTQSALLWVDVGRLLQVWPAAGQWRGLSVRMRLAVAAEFGRLITLLRLVGLVGLVGPVDRPRTGRLPGGRTRSTHASRVSGTGGRLLFFCRGPAPFQNACRLLSRCWEAATGRSQGLIACRWLIAWRWLNLLQARHTQPEQHVTED